MTEELVIAGVNIKPGERRKLSLNVARLYDFTEMNIPVEVIRGKKEGPTLFVSAALHGDEVSGTEIVKNLLSHRAINNIIHGTLIAVPIVNVFGFVHKSRYLPDRRDLNRSFPGSYEGSLASRIAYIFMTEIVEKCTHGIDLHTGAIHRPNMPHIRALISGKELQNHETQKLAHIFGAPMILNSSLVEGSLRRAIAEKNPDLTMLLYEGGEALRIDDKVIKIGLNGILSVMHELGMIAFKPKDKGKKKVFVAKSSHWVRAPQSGIFMSRKKLGQHVRKGELLGDISDPFGNHEFEVRAHKTGMIIGASVLPLVNNGDALFNIATFDESRTIDETPDTPDQAALAGQ